ncbi:hypothetical protein PV10_08703 [Exophiala mesophila]|uniref:Protein kinase domain-containing protein n=1 Tax=Exophiala mesophila TaxID=212818 RepID=A0A0D1Z5C9_EXOME|nr:uncharacterized protein PV10_08703 [Exophiala mesophila]KIV89099.1 hypothetical protein PV10_08703 [Exophiala mesophila]
MTELPFDTSTLTREQLRGVGIGISSEVVHILGTNIIAKIPAPQALEDHKVEKRIYDRLQSHPNILRYLGQSPPECTLLRNALLFEYHSHGTLINCLDQIIPGRSRWPFQAISAVAYIHSKGVVHGDLGLHNFLLHDDGRLVLCDFAGSGLDGSPPNVSAGVRYLNPLFDTDYPSESDDIFALGTVLYELHRGERLFNERSDQEISRYLRNKQFPDLSLVPSPLREVIEKCWTVTGYKASEAWIELGEYMTLSQDRPNL